MEWHKVKDNFVMATAMPNESEQAMMKLCEYVKERIIPGNDGVLWDCLRVELWADSGRMIVFPSLSSRADRIEKAGCQIVFADLLAEYERLADSDLDDDAFVAVLLRAEYTWIERFLEAARRVGLAGNRIQFWEGGSEHPILDTCV